MENYSTVTDVKEIRTAAKDALSEVSYKNKIENAIEANSIPVDEPFSFTGWKTKNDKTEYAHLRLDAEGKGSISVSSLQALAFFGKKEDAKFEKIVKKGALENKYYMVGTALNPHLSGDQSEVIARLLNKQVKAESVQGYTLRYKATGYTEAEARKPENWVAKTFYKIAFV